MEFKKKNKNKKKDTSCMFLLHRCLSGVDGFADAAQLEEERGEELILDPGRFVAPPTQPSVLGLTINIMTNS